MPAASTRLLSASAVQQLLLALSKTALADAEPLLSSGRVLLRESHALSTLLSRLPDLAHLLH